MTLPDSANQVLNYGQIACRKSQISSEFTPLGLASLAGCRFS